MDFIIFLNSLDSDEKIKLTEAMEQIGMFYSKPYASLTKLSEWPDLVKCSNRLRHALFNYDDYYPNSHLETVSIIKLIRIRNCGNECIEEFKRLRGF